MTIVPVLASPIPMPMSSSTDFFASRSLSNASAPALEVGSKALDGKRDLNLESLLPGLPRRDVTTFIGDIKTLNNYYGQMNQHAASFRKSSLRYVSSYTILTPGQRSYIANRRFRTLEVTGSRSNVSTS